MMLTKDSPEIVRLNAAALALNAAEAKLCTELPKTDDPQVAGDLARAVAEARKEFAAAFDVVEGLHQ